METKKHVRGVGIPSDREVPNPRANQTARGCEIAPWRRRECRALEELLLRRWERRNQVMDTRKHG